MSPKSKELIERIDDVLTRTCDHNIPVGRHFLITLKTRIEQLESAIDEFAEAQGRLEKIIADLESQVK